MKSFKKFIRNTFIGGLFFLIPLFVLITVAKKIWEFFQDLGTNLFKALGYDELVDVASSSIFSAVMVLLVCFLFGLIAKWSLAGRVRYWAEDGLQRVFPHYDYYRSLVEKKLNLRSKVPRPTVLVRRPGGWRPGILVEEKPSGEKVVFLPLSPKTTDGEVFLVAPEDVRDSELNENELNSILLKQGEGLTASN